MVTNTINNELRAKATW